MPPPLPLLRQRPRLLALLPLQQGTFKAHTHQLPTRVLAWRHGVLWLPACEHGRPPRAVRVREGMRQVARQVARLPTWAATRAQLQKLRGAPWPLP